MLINNFIYNISKAVFKLILKLMKMVRKGVDRYIKNINEDNDSESEPILVSDDSTCSEYKMSKKKQKLDNCEEPIACIDVEDDQSDYVENINERRPMSFCVLAAKYFGNFYQHDLRYEEAFKNALKQRINSDSLDQSMLHLAVMHDHISMLEYLLQNQRVKVNATDTKGRTALHVAAMRGNLSAVEVLFKYGASPNTKDKDGLTPLYFAVQSGSTDMVELLICRGCNVNENVFDYDLNRQHTYLHSAVERNHAEMTESLLRSGANMNVRDSYGSTPLHLAARDGRVEIARLLLHWGAQIHERDRNQMTPLFVAVDFGRGDVFELLLKNGGSVTDRGPVGASLLHLGVKRGDLDFLGLLLRHGVDVNAITRFGQTPLHYAVAEKNWCALHLLLKNGGDPNKANSLGKTPLHYAVEMRRTEAFELLFRYGAQVNARDNLKQTPLHGAVKQGCLLSVLTLLRHGADIDAVDNVQQTALHIAANQGHLELFEPLANHGADVNAPDAEGRTALHLAVGSEHSKLYYLRSDHTFVAKLLRHGADVRRRMRSAGQTALHLAVSYRCLAFARSLLRRGAEVDATETTRGRTPLHLAVGNSDGPCIDELLVFGADPGRPDTGGHTALSLAGDNADMYRIFVSYATRRRAAQLSMSSILRSLEKDIDPEYEKICLEEVSRMSTTKLYENVTYFSFLRASRRSLIKLARNPEIQELLEEQVLEIFPLYASMLMRNLDVGLLYEPDLEDASDRLTLLLGSQLPSLPLECVLSYLDARDMRCLIEAVPCET